jgi:hypothetical protein
VLEHRVGIRYVAGRLRVWFKDLKCYGPFGSYFSFFLASLRPMTAGRTRVAAAPDQAGGIMQKAVCTVVLALGVVFGAATSALAQTYPPTPAPLTISDSVVVPGQPVTVSGEGAEPGATVVITFASDPVVVATTTADSDGRFAASFKVPADATPGLHTVTATSNGVVLGTVTVRVLAAATATTVATPAATDNQLAFTGLNLLLKVGVGLGLILMGAAVLLAVRRRRASTSASV